MAQQVFTKLTCEEKKVLMLSFILDIINTSALDADLMILYTT